METQVEKAPAQTGSGETIVDDVERQTPSVGPKNEEPSSPPPNGGLRAWLVVAGGFGNMFCTFGFLNAFGYTSSDISWIGSVQVFFLLFCGFFSGPLSDRYGIRAVLLPAQVALVFALMMTSLAHEYYQFILANGILLGIANGVMYTPNFAIVSQYFTTKRALALGIVSIGASVGGIIYPVALDQMIQNPRLGFPWAVRIIAFMMLGIFVFTAIVMKEHAPRRTSQLLMPSAFKSLPYVFTTAGFFFASLGFWTPVYCTPEYARTHGVTSGLIFYEVAILNAASIGGRLVPNFFADKYGRFNVNVIMTFGTAIILFCWTASKGTAGVTVFTAFYGFFQGTFASMIGPCLADVTPNPSDIGTYVGMSLTVVSFAALTSQPINGAIIDNLGYLSASIFSAIMIIIGGLGYLTAKLLLNRNFFARV